MSSLRLIAVKQHRNFRSKKYLLRSSWLTIIHLIYIVYFCFVTCANVICLNCNKDRLVYTAVSRQIQYAYVYDLI